MKIKQKINLFALPLLILFLVVSFSNVALCQEEEEKKKKKKDPAKERKEIQSMRKEALKELYKLSPEAKTEIANSNGYAVFGNTGMNLLLVSTNRGSGIAHNNSSGKETYMKVISGGVGVGLGAKKYFAIFIFSSNKAFENFVEQGWAAETQADAAAQSDTQGGSVSMGMSIAPDVMLYQVTDVGIAAQATIQGTKYYKDDDLNE